MKDGEIKETTGEKTYFWNRLSRNFSLERWLEGILEKFWKNI